MSSRAFHGLNAEFITSHWTTYCMRASCSSSDCFSASAYHFHIHPQQFTGYPKRPAEQPHLLALIKACHATQILIRCSYPSAPSTKQLLSPCGPDLLSSVILLFACPLSFGISSSPHWTRSTIHHRTRATLLLLLLGRRTDVVEYSCWELSRPYVC